MKPTHLLLPIFSLLALSACQTLAIKAASDTASVAAEQRTFGEAVDDSAIYTEINHYFLQTDINDLLPNVNVTVRQGRVLLTGKVDKHETAVKAVREAWKADAVREVINEIEVIPEGGIFSRANDELIEKQLEARMLVTKGINILNYSIEVVNRKVYLLGLAMSEEELRNAVNVARTTKGVTKVISHLRLPKAQTRQPLDNI